jgi:hypothetical protein
VLKYWRLLSDSVTAWSVALSAFARPNTGIVGLDPTGGMDVFLCIFCVCVVLCTQRPWDRADHPSGESYRPCKIRGSKLILMGNRPVYLAPTVEGEKAIKATWLKLLHTIDSTGVSVNLSVNFSSASLN